MQKSLDLPPDIAAALGRFGLDSLVEAAYLECRLAVEASQVDHLFAISRSDARGLSRIIGEHAWPALAANEVVHGALAELTRSWAGGISPVSVHVPTLWLEFDHAESEACSLPSVSLCLCGGYRVDRPLPPPDASLDCMVALDALRTLGRTDDHELQAVAECFDRLPDSGRFIHLSVMLGRSPASIKLYGTMPRECLLPYLHAIGFAGAEAGLESTLAELYPRSLLGDWLFVDINLSTYRDASRCNLGIAVAQQHSFGAWRDVSRAAILQLWARAGLCAPEKAETLLSWVERTRSSGRTFFDLKLVWQANGGSHAKAYLGFH